MSLEKIKQYLESVNCSNYSIRFSKSKQTKKSIALEMIDVVLQIAKDFNEIDLGKAIDLLRNKLTELANYDEATSDKIFQRWNSWYNKPSKTLQAIVEKHFPIEKVRQVQTLIMSNDDYLCAREGYDKKTQNSKSLTFDWEKYKNISIKLLKSANWLEKYLALIAVSGCRPSELLLENAFELVEIKGEKRLYFNSQLKKRTIESDSFQKFTLIPVEDFFEIWKNWVESTEIKERVEKCREKALSRVSESYSDYEFHVKFNEVLNHSFNHRLSDCVKLNFDFLDVPGRIGKEKVTAKNLRAIYGCLVVSMNCDQTDSRECENFFQKQLGHDDSSITKIYKDYKLVREIEGFGMFEFDFDSQTSENIQKDLSQETFSRLEKLAKSQGIDAETLLTQLLDSFELTLEVEQSKPIPKLEKALEKIIEHNENNIDCPNNLYTITVRLLIDVTGTRHSIVKKFFEKHQEKIQKHNEKYGLFYSNRGKVPLVL